MQVLCLGASKDPLQLAQPMGRTLRGGQRDESPARRGIQNVAVRTWRDGRTVSGYLSSVSDFKVIVRDETGKEDSFPRREGEPKVVLKDRLQHHLDMLTKYKDSDMHDLTAYLATLK